MVETTSLKSGINLIPKDTSSPEPVRKAVYYGLMVSRYAVVVVGVIIFALLGYQSYLNNQLVTMKEQIEDDLSYIRSKEQFERSFGQFKTYAQVLGETHSALKPQVGVFTQLEELMPTQVRLVSFTYGSETVRLSASTLVYPAISDFVAALNESDFAESVKIVSINRRVDENQDEGIIFTLEIKT